MLSFLSPLFLAGAAAAAVPLVLHLLKREPEARVKFAAVKLIKQAPVEYTDRRRLRELLLLALRVTALVLLALAFARPFLATGAAVGSTGVTMVALDTSYSLAAPGRFERAKQLAKDAIAKAPAGDLVGVVTFADDAEVVAKPGSD
ncbi:MAG TPA: BatA domain-containing protein, partial [Vicinamibacterales bacterium]|nr:BatA domain-containing protein [Vicinamibacterales bacterium]